MNGSKKTGLLLILVWILTIILAGCEYDIKQPLWYQNFKEPAVPKITQLVPDKVAPAGINRITILGENFGSVIGDNDVYFNNVAVEILSACPDSVTVRRPNIVSDSAVVTVVPHQALVVAKYSPYKIDLVQGSYGSFLDNLVLAALAVDADENLYVIENTSRIVYKITPEGDKTQLAVASRIVFDATIAPSGKLTFLISNTAILQMDPVTGAEETWVTLKKRVTCGDFDQYGAFYAGGKSTDLIVVKPDLTNSSNGGYASLEIVVIRAYKDFLYVVANNSKPDATNPAVAVYRHAILDANGTLGERELILDWSTTGDYAASTINDIAFSENGTMYIATNNANPIFMLNSDNSQDILYKTILPTTAEKLAWGSSHYAYMIRGGTNWEVIRIDMGTLGGF
jgi:WD40 repeat protein